MSEEIWKNTEYDGYMVSNKGRVRSKNKILSENDNGRGYLTVQMSIKNHPFRRYIHRLVANAFVDNPHNYPQINHKDGNKRNNNVDNLEWVTPEMNSRHAWTTGLCKGFERTENYKRKVSESVKGLWKKGVYKPYVRTKEMRENMRLAQLKSPNKKRGANHPQAKMVRCIETGEFFDCIRYADKKYGGSGVKGVFAGKQKTAYNMHWELV